jgi:hypothetical protein
MRSTPGGHRKERMTVPLNKGELCSPFPPT